MTKTYTPLIIEGKIYVVEQEPRVADYGTEDITHGRFYKDCQEFHSRQPKQLPTLPEHAPYWKERIGQRVEVEFEEKITGMAFVPPHPTTTYAIPPQQKQGDLWKQFLDEVVQELDLTIDPRELGELIKRLKQRYRLSLDPD